MTAALTVEEQKLEAPHPFMATWLSWVLLAMESHDVVTGLEFNVDLLPEEKAEKLKRACVSGQVMVSVPNPEPYVYLSKEVCGSTLRIVRGVVMGRRAAHYKPTRAKA